MVTDESELIDLTGGQDDFSVTEVPGDLVELTLFLRREPDDSWQAAFVRNQHLPDYVSVASAWNDEDEPPRVTLIVTPDRITDALDWLDETLRETNEHYRSSERSVRAAATEAVSAWLAERARQPERTEG